MNTSTLYRQALGEGRNSDAWQVALTTDTWPRVLIAPPGSGKTAVVTLGWAAHRLRRPEHTPRRLVWCLPMRTFVEQTAEAVRVWFGKMAADGQQELPPVAGGRARAHGRRGSRRLAGGPERPAVQVGAQDTLSTTERGGP